MSICPPDHRRMDRILALRSRRFGFVVLMVLWKGPSMEKLLTIGELAERFWPNVWVYRN
jgi:hypothetical protein